MRAGAAVVRHLPGAGVSLLCVAVAAALVVPAVLDGSRKPRPLPVPAPPSAPASTSSLQPGCSATTTGKTVHCTYNYTTDNVRSLVVPAGVQTIQMVLWGAPGGGVDTTPGGHGAHVIGTIDVTTIAVGEGGWNRTLYITVGGDGGGSTDPTPDGAWPGGGNGGFGHSTRYGGGGGGWTGVTVSGTVAVAVAGAGAGAGSYGAGATAVDGGSGGQNGGGGSNGGGTDCFIDEAPGGYGGGGATPSNVGGGGGGNACSAGTSGASGSGHSGGGGGRGNGAAHSGGGGGGGGGGWYGGGGGGGGGTDGSGGGGGGGSSGVHGTTWVTGAAYTGFSYTYAQVTLSWSLQSTTTSLVLTPSSVPAGATSVPAGWKTVVLDATVHASGPTLGGTVEFKGSGGAAVSGCTAVPVSAAGAAVCRFRNPGTLGAQGYTATYGGNSAYAASTSSAVTLTTVTDPTSVTAVIYDSATSNLEATVTPQAYASDSLSGGKVHFYDKLTGTATAASLACTQTISTGLAAGTADTVDCHDTKLVPGSTYTLSAGFAGEGDNGSSTSTVYSQKVTKVTPTVTLHLTSAAPTPASVTYGEQVTVQATVKGLPGGDASPGTVTYQQAGGTAITCTGSGQRNPAPVTAGTGLAGPCTVVPGTGGKAASEKVLGAYAGDAETNPASSAASTIAVGQAGSATTVTVTPKGGSAEVGVPVTVVATVTDTSHTTAPPDGVVEFEEGASRTPVAGCTAVPATDGRATCTAVAAPTTLTPITVSANYCPSTPGSACTDWQPSASALVTYTAAKDSTSVTFSPPATQTHPVTATGGKAITVHALVADAAPTGSAPVGGHVTFVQNGQVVTATGGGTCSTVPVGTTGQVSCTFVPVPGNLDTVVATYVPAPSGPSSLTTGSASVPWYVKVSGQPTALTLVVDGPSGSAVTSAAYGVPLTATATVTSGTTPVTAGTAAFTVDGVPVAACSAQPVDHAGTATCGLPASVLAAGAHTVGAAFAYAGGTYGNSNGTAGVTVTAAPTATSLAAGPDATTAGDILLTATVADTAPGAATPPAGTVAFAAAGTTIASCTAVPLAAAGGATATATCAVPAPAAATTYAATYAPAAGDFATSTEGTTTFTPGAACSAAFADVWAQAGGTFTFTAGRLGGATDGMSVSLGSVSGGCTATLTVPFTGASLSLFGKTLAVTGSLRGYVEEAGGAVQACVTGGSLGLPGGWDLGSVSLSAGEALCFTVGTVSGANGVLTGVSASLTVTTATLPAGVPDPSVAYRLTLTLASSPAPELVVHVAPAGTPPAGTPFATLTVTVTGKTGGFAGTGALEIGNVPFVGSPLQATFHVAGGSSGSIAGSFTFALPTATYAPVPGLQLGGLSVTLSSSTGLTVKATATLGYGAQQLTVSLTGAYDKGTWSLTLAATPISPWSPFSGLTLTPTLKGSLSIATGGGHTVVTYDFEGGTVPSGGSGGTPLATWSPVPGVTLTIDCVAFAFGVAPACAAGPGATSPTDPTLYAQGSLAVGGSGGLAVGFMGSVDLKSGRVTLSLDATAGPASVTPVPGLTLTVTGLTVSGRTSSLEVTGTATAAVPVLGATAAHPFTVSFRDQGGTLVVAGGHSFASLGVPLTGFFAYASAAVSTYATGQPTIGTVDLAQGFNGWAVYHPTAGVIAVLQQVGFTLPSGDAVTFTATWTPKGSPTFTAVLASPSSGFPFLSLPDGGSITSASLSYSAGALSLAIAGTIPVPGSAPAQIQVQLTVGSGGTFSGTATVTGLVVFGQDVGLVGTISRSASGAITATVSSCQPTAKGCVKGPIAGPFTPFPGVPLQLSTVSFSLGTGGLAVAGTMTVDGLGSLTVSGTLQSLRTWAVTVTAAAAHSWSPAPGVTISPSFTGTVTDAAGTVTFSLTASGSAGTPLFTLSPPGVTLSITSVGLGNAPPPKGCTVKKVGDLWLTVDGSLAVSAAGLSGSVAAAGCFDLTGGGFTVTATFTQLSFSALTGNLTFGAPTVVVSETGKTYQAAIDATLTVKMPSGGTLVFRATLQVEHGGGFVVGAEVNLSQWLGTDGDTAYLYYASKAVSGFSTGDPTLAKIDLVQGLNFALAIHLPTTVISGLGDIGIHLPAHTALTALGTADFATDTYSLKISISLGTGVQLFTSGGTAMYLVTGFLEVKLSPSTVQFSVGLTARLHVAPPTTGATGSTVALVGEISVSDTGVSVSLSLGTCGGSTPGWTDAFGLTGLTVKCAGLTGGITFEPPFVNIGLYGTITSLPSVVANPTGYQDGAPISFAFNLDPFLLSLSIGTKTSTTPALEPLSYFGQGTLIKVYYASLYISPTGATIGTQHFTAGISLAFHATLFSVNVALTATIGLSPPSIHFSATISKITVGPLSIGPVSVLLTASPSNFEFQFTGTATLGPGSTKIGPLLKVGGKLSASVQVELSKSGFSAFIWGTVAVTVAALIAQTTCYTDTIWPYPCNYQWEGTGFSAHLTRTGFSVTSSGVTLEVDGYSVTFDYDGKVSVSTAEVHRAGPGPVARGRLAVAGRAGDRHHRPSPGMVLAADDQPLRPTAHPLPPTTPPAPAPGPGHAILVPTPSSGTGGGSSGASGSSGSGTGSSTGAGTGTTASGQGSVGVAPAGSGTVVGTWSGVPSMGQDRAFAAEATLHDGDVLVAGGLGAGKSVLASAEVYDPATRHWAQVGTLGTPRAGATAAVLPDGDVLVAGGLGADHQPLRSAEIYDPRTGTWSSTGQLGSARGFPQSAGLPGGDVLVLGGTGPGHGPLRSAEIYDPRTGRFSPTGSLSTPRAFAAVTTLGDGDVLVAGGQGPHGALATAERYHPSTGRWSPAGTMSVPRTMAAAVTLPGGDALVVGDGADGDRYDPATGAWTTTEGMAEATTMPLVAALPGGRVLVAGDDGATSGAVVAEVYQPRTTGWADAGTMASAREGAAVAALSNGQVLVAGGGDVTGRPGQRPVVSIQSSAEIYSPPAGAGRHPSSPNGTPVLAVAGGGFGGAPLVVTVVGGSLLAVAALSWLVVSDRRRRRRRPATDPG